MPVEPSLSAQRAISELGFELPLDFLARPFLRINAKHGPVNAKIVKLRNLMNDKILLLTAIFSAIATALAACATWRAPIGAAKLAETFVVMASAPPSATPEDESLLPANARALADSILITACVP